MITLGKKKNLFYPIMIIIINLINKIIIIILNLITDFGDYDIIKSFVMFLSEFCIGLILFKRDRNLLFKNNIQKDPTFKGIQLINKYEYKYGNKEKNDSTFKIYFLIISISFFDFYDYILSYEYLDNLDGNFSLSVSQRTQSILALYSGVFCYILFKIPIYRHQKFSLIIIFICIIIILITDIYYFRFESKYDDLKLIKLLSLSFIELFFHSTVDIIEKYLFEFNKINPFQLLMFEGIFGFLFTFLYSFYRTPFTISLNSDTKLILFILYMLVYVFLAAISNSYRLVTNKLFSPAGLSLVYYFLTPFQLIYNYMMAENNDKPNIYFFVINVCLAFIISFCGCIYNEIFVIFMCNLDHDTYYSISLRSKKDEISINKLESVEDINLS